jgi:hypothetical protein
MGGSPLITIGERHEHNRDVGGKLHLKARQTALHTNFG